MTALNIPIDAAAARLRAASYTVEKQGMHWRVSPPGGELAITTADEVRTLALGLSEPAEAPPALAPIVLMDRAEARRSVEQIKTHLDSARRILLDLYEREGWRALGYAAWRDCATAEFGQSAATLYRQLDAAQIERDISQVEKSGTPIPATQLQPLKALPPEQRPEAWQRAGELAGDGKRTAVHVQQAVREIKPAPALPAITAHTCECGKPGIIEDNIAGISGWWCEACATTEERGDLLEQLGPQYRGESGKVRYGRILHSIRWDGGPVGDYTYHDALTEIHTRAQQQRKQPPALAKQLAPPPPDPPADPRAAAVAWRTGMRTMLAQCPDSTSFRKSEMAQAVGHIDALLALLSVRDSDSADVWAALGDLLLSDERARLMACRGALQAVVAEPVIETDVYDALSHRIGDAERRLIEMEQVV